MADILIRGVKMPKSCYICWVLDDYGDYPLCRITDEQRGYTFPVREKRMDNCPLIPLPKGHGRLVDADHLKLMLEKNFGSLSGADILRQIIDMVPTIVPAEGDDENDNS